MSYRALQSTNGYSKKYDLRWRFDFAGRASKWGKWSSPGQSPELKAWSNNKEGLVRACIEGQDVETQSVSVLAECDGHDFVNFQWEAVAMMPANRIGQVKPIHALVGLKLVTRDEEICVASSGGVSRRIRPECEKKIHFATFGR